MLSLLFFLLSSPSLAEELRPLKCMESVVMEKAPPICRRMRALSGDLAKLTPLYDSAKDIDPVLVSRAAITQEMYPLGDEFERLHKEYKTCEEALQTDIAFRALDMRRKAEAPDAHQAENSAGLGRYIACDRAYRDARDCIETAMHAVWADDDVLKAAMDKRSRSRLRRRIAAGSAAAVALFAALLALLSRKLAARTVRQALAVEPQPLPPAEPAAPGLLAGNIQLGRILGQGGMGVVYEAMDVTLDRKVAVKCMRDEVSDDPRGLAQFMAEAKLVAALKHPNIVEIYSIIKEKGKLYLIFEHVEGNTLEAALAHNGRLSLEQSLSVLTQAASALDYAHSKKVIHRDLKPSNIMLTPAGVARLMDFGIAYQAKKTIARLTRAEMWGTPAFMSPEQELGEIGRESDLFALAACFYCMLTGHLPFPGPDFLAQKRGLCVAGWEGVPERLQPVLKKALDPDPARRYHSGAELLSAIEALPS